MKTRETLNAFVVADALHDRAPQLCAPNDIKLSGERSESAAARC